MEYVFLKQSTYYRQGHGQIQRFRDYLPLEMADNVLTILENLPEE